MFNLDCFLIYFAFRCLWKSEYLLGNQISYDFFLLPDRFGSEIFVIFNITLTLVMLYYLFTT